MQLTPYIFFYGRCEEALEYYRVALGGTYELQRNDTGPLTQDVPADFKGKVMHAKFMVGGSTLFFASDGRNGRTIDPEEGNVSLMIEMSDNAEGDRVFKALSAGGNVMMPLEHEFWGGRLGVFHDRFGIEWMVASP